MAHAGAPPAHAVTGSGPRSAPPPLQSERREEKRDLAGWWKNFKRGDKKAQEQQPAPQGIFGVPLQQSIRYANVAISLLNDEGQSYIYGYVPIVVAKCGVFLKEKATDIEGIFRLAGSEKRIKELKIAFDSPDRFGKGLDWTGYTVHDAANILRRYFNQLPEPIIPLDFYDRFRDPLRNHQAQAVGSIEAQSPSVGDFDPDSAIREYQNLITELPPLNRQLLLYILDLLAVFASKSDLNKMTTPNLAAIFQPGILSHPQHDMSPPEYRLSQDVLIFLIENQDSFLIGMQGTAADAETVKDVQSGLPTPPKAPATPTTPGRSKTIIGRSSSNSSSAAESVRRFGSLRRNASTASSKRSRKSENGHGAVAGGVNGPTTPPGGVHRSNTVPSRRGGSNATSPRFSREKSSDPSTPNTVGRPAVVLDAGKSRQESLQSTPVAITAPQFPAASTSSSEATTALPAGGIDTTSAQSQAYQTPKRDTTPLLSSPSGSDGQSVAQPPSTSSGKFLDIFKPSPTSDSDTRKPNKLKKRIPGTSLSSAQSSSNSLSREAEGSSIPTGGSPTMNSTADVPSEKVGEQLSSPAPTANTGLQAPRASAPRSPGDALRPKVSPPQSFRSATEEMSDVDLVGDDMPKEEQPPQPEREQKRRRWRFSRSQNKLEQTSPQQSPNPFGVMTAKEQTTSRSTFGSNGAQQPRRSFQDPAPQAPAAADPFSGSPFPGQAIQPSTTDPAVFSDSERERNRGPMSWIRGKMKEHKEKETEKRTHTPERGQQRASRQDLQLPAEAMPVRGKPLEKQRENSTASGPPDPTPISTTLSPQATQMDTPAPASAPEASSAPAQALDTPAPASAPVNIEQEPAAPSPTVPLTHDHSVEGLQNGETSTTKDQATE